MSAFVETPVSPPTAPIFQSRTFGERLSMLPDELVVQILEYAVALPGTIAKKNFWGGRCEWPECLCEKTDWRHTPGHELTTNTLIPLLLTLKPILRLARYVFYRSNTFHVCGPHCDMDWTDLGVWLPPPDIRHWIRRLEVEVFIEVPRTMLLDSLTWEPGKDIIFLRRMQQVVKDFTELKTLRLMFDTAYHNMDEMLTNFNRGWSTIEPIRFQTPELKLEACSAYPGMGWAEPSTEGDLVRDERLERALAKYVSTTGTMKLIDGDGNRDSGECYHW